MSTRKPIRGVLASACLLLTLPLEGCAGPGTKQLADAVRSITPGSSRANSTDCSTGGLSIYFAKPLCETYNGVTASAVDADADGQKKIDFAWAVVKDSDQKCLDFVNLFTGSQAAENTFFDTTALLLSGLAAVFTPVGTVRGLAAGSTAVQGTKQAINSDLYQQMTMLLLVQQIDSIYYGKREAIVDSIPNSKAEAADFSASKVLNDVAGIHRYCSIPFAAAAIASQGKVSTGTTATVSTSPGQTAVKVSGTITANDVVTLTAKSTSTGFPVSVSYTVVAADVGNPANVAKGLRDLVYHNLLLAKAGIGATPPDPDLPGAGSVQFTLLGGPADVAWQATSSGPKPAGGGTAPVGSESLTVTPPAKSS